MPVQFGLRVFLNSQSSVNTEMETYKPFRTYMHVLEGHMPLKIKLCAGFIRIRRIPSTVQSRDTIINLTDLLDFISEKVEIYSIFMSKLKEHSRLCFITVDEYKGRARHYVAISKLEKTDEGCILPVPLKFHRGMNVEVSMYGISSIWFQYRTTSLSKEIMDMCHLTVMVPQTLYAIEGGTICGGQLQRTIVRVPRKRQPQEQKTSYTGSRNSVPEV